MFGSRPLHVNTALISAILGMAGCVTLAYSKRSTIPAGDYIVGCTNETLCSGNPRRVAHLEGFEIEQREVTIHEYESCVRVGRCRALSYRADEPNETVTLDVGSAESYCAWRGGVVPTDEEWEAAARGKDERQFPWGNQYVAENLADAVFGKDNVHFVAGTRPRVRSPFGLLDVSGTWAEFAHTGRAVHLRGAPIGVLTTDPAEFSVVRIRDAGANHASFRCVYPR